MRGCARMCAGVCWCAQVCAGLRRCTSIFVGVRRCVGMCGYARVCEGVYRCARVCMGVHMGVGSIFRISSGESLHQRTLICILYEFFQTIISSQVGK